MLREKQTHLFGLRSKEPTEQKQLCIGCAWISLCGGEPSSAPNPKRRSALLSLKTKQTGFLGPKRRKWGIPSKTSGWFFPRTRAEESLVALQEQRLAHDSARVTATGHSLGGAVAALCGRRLGMDVACDVNSSSLFFHLGPPMATHFFMSH